MLVLHGLWSSASTLRLWGEESSPPARRSRVTDLHPFAAGHARLESLGTGGRRLHAKLLLPTRAGTPVPSPSLPVEAPSSRGRAAIAAWRVPVLELEPLAAIDVLIRPTEDARAAPSVPWLARAFELALAMLVRGRVLPTLVDGEARWAANPAPDDAARLRERAAAMPPACRAELVADAPNGRLPSEILTDLVASVVDAVARDAFTPPSRRARRASPVHAYLCALGSPDARVDAPALVEPLEAWGSSGVRAAGPVRTCFRLAAPDDDAADVQWRVEILLQSNDDPSLLVGATDVWRAGRALALLDHSVADPQERLLEDLGRATRLWPELEAALEQARPEAVVCTTSDAYRFLSERAPMLEQAGFGVIVPSWWGRPSTRLGLRMRATTKKDPSEPSGLLGMESLARFHYEVALGGETISSRDLKALARLKAPLVRVRGQWVELGAADVERALAALARPEEVASAAQVLRIGLGLDASAVGLPVVDVEADGWLGELLGSQDDRKLDPATAPSTFDGTLRPYQERGLGWLRFLDTLGLGACLADDMGLGKAQPLDAKVLTPSGWRLMGEIRIGDEVVTSKGGRARVLGVHPQGEKDIYRVEFSDGAWTECCDEHLWFVSAPVRGERHGPARVLPLRDIRDRLRDGAGNLQHFVPLVAPAGFDGRELPIDPYLLGSQIVRRSAVVQLGPAPKQGIPREYLFASIDERESLLQGLLDGDGHVRAADNRVELTTTSLALAEDVRELVQSLGGTARLRERAAPSNGERRHGRRAYRLTLALPDSIRPFRLERKARVYRSRTKCPPCRAITRVEPVGRKQAQCIAVDAPDQLYVTDGYVLTHNTPQLLALLLAERSQSMRKPFAPTLLVCPMSLVGNWQREAARFAPSLRVHVHHGVARAGGKAFAAASHNADLVLTTYALAARDRDLLASVRWGRVVLDEAQNVKNASSRQAQAVRSLPAARRVALTGTPVENRLAELWSIMEFLNPGLLGSQKGFRERFVVPIERYRDDDAAATLRRVTQPFMLRRLKTDRTIVADLPDKIEMNVFCNLTREQATLYQAVVDDMLARIEDADDIQRKGLVLATMTKLKQVCNHPAQFLKDGSRLDGRSGKLERLTETLEEVAAEGERALVFTQYAEMGTLLRTHLRERIGGDVPFLHGGVPKRARDEMVADFQDGRGGPVFLLSLKAGGVGLNLTAATHVVHFDRWWNPAVEDQATDRAFRIGQTRNVQVRKLVCVGTLEERIDELIASKRELAERIVGTGEAWLTELSTAQIRELVALGADAVAEG